MRLVCGLENDSLASSDNETSEEGSEPFSLHTEKKCLWRVHWRYVHLHFRTYKVISKPVSMFSVYQGWGAGAGAGAGRSRVFLASWSRSRLKKNRSRSRSRLEKSQEPEPEPLKNYPAPHPCEKIKGIRKLYFSYSSFSKILRFMVKKQLFYLFNIFFVVLPY